MTFISTVTWDKAIKTEMRKYSETFDDIEDCSLDKEQFDKLLQSNVRSQAYTQETSFKIKTKNRLYFPAPYYKQMWCASVRRSDI